MERRMGQFSSLVVQIRSPDRARNLAFADALARRLAREPLVERASWGLPELHQLIEREKWLYADEATLQQALDRLAFEKARAGNPFFVALAEGTSLDELS